MDSQDMEKKETAAEKAASAVSALKKQDFSKFLNKDEGSLVSKFLFFNGRLDRLPYILRMTALWVATMIIVFILALIGFGSSLTAIRMGIVPQMNILGGFSLLLIFIILIIAVVSYMSLAWRRLHDMDKTGLLALVIPACIILGLIPFVGIIFQIIQLVFSIWLLISRGSYGNNQYGEDILLKRSQNYVGKAESEITSVFL